MPTLKKLAFAPLFLIMFALSLKYFDFIAKQEVYFIFSLSFASLLQLILLSSLIALSSLLFVLFVSLSQDWKLVLPVIFLASLLPLLYEDKATGFVLMIGIFIVLIITYLSLENSLKSYLSFLPSSLLGPSIRHLASLLIMVVAIAYFLSINKVISQNGFQIPDSLIETALKFAPIESLNTPETQTPNQQVSIPKEQLDELKKNPDLLKQAGIDPKILDNFNQQVQKTTKNTTNLGSDFLKQTVKDQLQNFFKPYLAFIPAALALLLFLTLQSLYSLINMFIYPLLWFIFFALEKSGFVKFTTEMRPVKKMVT